MLARCNASEQRDADDIEDAICEINTGLMSVSAGLLNVWLPQLDRNNEQKEYLLTDLVALANEEDHDVADAADAQSRSTPLVSSNPSKDTACT